MTYFDPKATNSSVTGCSGVAGSPMPRRLFLVKTGVNDTRNNLPLSKNQFMPRLGFAYSPDQKDGDSRRIRDLLHPELRCIQHKSLCRSGQQLHLELFRQQQPRREPGRILNANTCNAPGDGTITCLGAGPFNQGTSTPALALTTSSPYRAATLNRMCRSTF